MQTSAKDGTGVDALFQKVEEMVYSNSLANDDLFSQARKEGQSFKVDSRPKSGLTKDEATGKTVEAKKDGCC